MASGDVFETLRVRDFVAQNGIPQDVWKPRLVPPLMGYPLRKASNDGFYAVAKVWQNGSPLAAGLTLKVTTVDDPNNANPGGNYVLGASGARLVPGTTNLATLAATAPLGAESQATVAAAATSGVATTTTLAITNAALGGPAAGDLVVLYVRRLGNLPADTHTGEPLVLEVVVQDT